ncbi:MAG: hypothetical protein PHY94_01595, partial [Candidatus Omnitrophica bacterium]|nr:hypothetical protein [Candidatus Omnitrophota bacterium]
MNIFVGNLPFNATQDDVKKLFEGYGTVASVAIVMTKEKKTTPKSRGFGFVEMIGEQQALEAIIALNGSEFMGRVLNIEVARPKKEVLQEAIVEDKVHSVGEEKPQPQPEFKKFVKKPGRYMSGRRTHSYLSKRGLTEIPAEKLSRKKHDNPMRWRKNRSQPKPWEKGPGEHKPWEKSVGEHKPWKKTEGEHKPWQKAADKPKPWRKSASEAKSRHKPESG